MRESHRFPSQGSQMRVARLLAIGCGFLFPSAIAAQETRIDSLEAALAAATEDTTRVRVLYDLAAEHYVLAADSAITLAERGIQLSEDADNAPAVADGYYWLGRSLVVSGNFQRAFESLFAALESYELLEDTVGQGDSNFWLGMLLYETDADQALRYWQQYLTLSRLAGDSVRIAHAVGAVGVAHRKLGEGEAALEHFATALELLSQLGSGWTTGTAGYNNPEEVRSMLLSNTGSVFYLRGEYETALSYFQQTVEAAAGMQNYQTPYFAANIGRAHAGLGNWREARGFASQAYEDALALGAPVSIAYTAEFYQEVLRELGDYRTAYEVLELSVAMRDSINSAAVEKESIRRQLEHEHEKQQAVTRMIIAWVSSGLAVLLFFSAWLFNRYRVIREQSGVITLQKNRMEDELNIARGIQISLMPSTFPEREELDLYAGLEPAREVGGDFYDYFFIDDDRICIVVGDVSGKGAPAALFMAVTKTLLKSNVEASVSAGTVMTRTNEELSRGNDSAMFVTVYLGILNTKTGEMEYSNAGHNPPYIRRESGEMERLGQRHGPVLGAVEGLTYGEDRVKLSGGDLLLLYTDGVTEAMDPAGTLFSEERLVGILTSDGGKSAEEVVRWTIREVHSFEGEANQADDITVLAVQARGSA